jgi:hypothetical protein
VTSVQLSCCAGSHHRLRLFEGAGRPQCGRAGAADCHLSSEPLRAPTAAQGYEHGICHVDLHRSRCSKLYRLPRQARGASLSSKCEPRWRLRWKRHMTNDTFVNPRTHHYLIGLAYLLNSLFARARGSSLGDAGFRSWRRSPRVITCGRQWRRAQRAAVTRS